MRYVVVLLLLGRLAAAEETPSAFRFQQDKRVKAGIDLKEVLQGVRTKKPDPRDVIPAIRKPRTVPAKRATWLEDDDRVLGVSLGGEARAYPLRILEVHEMVNDVLAGVPIAPNY
jgi:hypothetical protein